MLRIRTFGGLHISLEGQTEPILAGRRTKMWELLKYLLAFYPRPVAIDKLVEVIWPDAGSNDPAKDIREIVYKLRRAFLPYGGAHDYIFFVNGCCFWNPDAECFIDFVEFNRLLGEAEKPEKSDEERIFFYNKVISLYQGEFMGEKGSLSSRWISNFVSFYRNLFLQAVKSLSDLYERKFDYENVIFLYNKALLIEPYEESLYERLIQVLIKNGEYSLAKREYKKMEKFFFREFDAPPSQTLQDLYEEAVKASLRKPIPLSRIKERFGESAEHSGPIFCAPDTFSHICSYGKRIDERITFPVFLCKATLLNAGESDLSKLEQAMKALLRILLCNLRKGDIVCRYSPNQFLMMLATMNASHLHQGIQRINSFFRDELEFREMRLEMEIAPIKGDTF